MARSLLVLFASALAVLALSAAPAMADNPLTWSSPKVVDEHTPFSSESSAGGISCVSTALCVVANQTGVTVSTNAAAGEWGHERAWGRGYLSISGISCNDDSVVVNCLAMDQYGTVYAGPATADPSTWTATHLVSYTGPLSHGENRISCSPSGAAACLVSYGGVIYGSNDPFAASPTWTSHQMTHDSPAVDSAYLIPSCKTALFCAVLDNDGWFMTTTDPASGVWSTGKELDADSGLSCSYSQYCVAVGGGISQFTNNPASGNSSTWSTARTVTTSGDLYTVSCSPLGDCAAFDYQGHVYSTADPSAGWAGDASDSSPITPVQNHHRSSENFEAISCVDGPLCAAVNFFGEVVATTSMTGQTAASWPSSEAAGSNPLSSVDCPSSTLCLASDWGAHVISSTDPAANNWSSVQSPDTLASDGEGSAVACPTTSLCVLGDGASGHYVTTSDPAGSIWSSVHDTNAQEVENLTCTQQATPACLAISQGDGVTTSNDPVAGGDWSAAGAAGDDDGDFDSALDGSCTTDNSLLCVVTLPGGNSAFLATAPAGALYDFSAISKIDTAATGDQADLYAISCAASSLCVAGDASGHLLSTTTPTNPASWSAASVDPGHEITAVSCRIKPDMICVAVDDDGNAISSTNPTGGAGAWTVHSIDGVTPLLAISCRSGNLCVATDLEGQAIVATGSGAPTPDQPGGSGGSGGSGGGSSPVVKPGPTPPSSSQIIAGLLAGLKPSGKASKISAIVKAGSFSSAQQALEGGKLTIGWYELPKGAHIAKAKPLLVAGGSVSFGAAGSQTIKIKLNSAGKKLLKKAKKQKLTAKATFTPTGAGAVSTTAAFTLKK